MTRYDIFPIVLILVNLGAAAVYLTGGNWRKVVFFGAAATINFVATF